MAVVCSSLRILLSDTAPAALTAAAERLCAALQLETLRPCRVATMSSLTPAERRFDGLTLLTDPLQIAAIAAESGEDIADVAAVEGDRIVIRHLRAPVGVCLLAWGSSVSAAQRALAIIGEYLGLRVFPWGRVVAASHDERELVSADVVLQARHQVRALAPVRMTDRCTWTAGDIAAYVDFAAWNGYNLLCWPVPIGSAAAPLRAGLACYQDATIDATDNSRTAFAASRERGIQVAAAFDPLRLPARILDATPAGDLHPGGLTIQPFSDTGRTLYRHLAASLYAAYKPDALVLSMSEPTWRPSPPGGPGARGEHGWSPDALAYRAQLLGVYGPAGVAPATELYLQAAAALAEATRYLELDLPVVLTGRGLAHLVAQQHQVLPENTLLCPIPSGDLVTLADQVTRDAARGVPLFFDHLHSNHRSVWGGLSVDETFLGDSPRVRSLDTILGAWLKSPMQGFLLRHSRLHGCDENLLYAAQAMWGELPAARLFYAELSGSLYGAAAEMLARARQGQEEIEAVSSAHDQGLAADRLVGENDGDDFLPSEAEWVDRALPTGASPASAGAPETPPTRSLRRIVAELLDRMPFSGAALPEASYLLSFLRDLSSRNIRLAGILQAVEGSLARRDLLTATEVARVERAVGRLTAKLEMGRFARAVMSAALLCRQASDPDLNGTYFGALPTVGGLTILHQALTTLKRSPPTRILEVLQHEHSCDRQATATVIEQTLVEPWRQLVSRLERALGSQVAGRVALGAPPIELIDAKPGLKIKMEDSR